MTARNLTAFGIAFVAVALGAFAGCNDWTMPAADPTAEADPELVALRGQLETLVAEQGQISRTIARERVVQEKWREERHAIWVCTAERPCPVLSYHWPPLWEARSAIYQNSLEIKAVKAQIADREAALAERK